MILWGILEDTSLLSKKLALLQCPLISPSVLLYTADDQGPSIDSLKNLFLWLSHLYIIWGEREDSQVLSKMCQRESL